MPCKCCTPAPVKHKQYVRDVCYGTRYAQRDGRLAEWNRSADAWHHGGRGACLRAMQGKLFYTISLANEANEVTGGYGTMNTGALITPDLTTEEAAKVVPYEPLLFVGESRADWRACVRACLHARMHAASVLSPARGGGVSIITDANHRTCRAS